MIYYCAVCEEQCMVEAEKPPYLCKIDRSRWTHFTKTRMSNNQYTLEGVVSHIGDLQTFDSGFTKREFVVTTEGKYPQEVKFELVKDRCRLAESLTTSTKVEVSFNIRGNAHKDRFYVNLQAWKIEKLGEVEGNDAAINNTSWDEHDAKHDAREEAPASHEGEEDDIPF